MEDVVEHLEKAPLSRFHYQLLVLGSFIYGLTAMNVLLISAVLTPIVKEFGIGQQPLTTGLLLAAGYAGMFVGAFVCGILADFIGRKKTLLLTISSMSVFTALNALASDPTTMAVLRFIAGIGLGGSLPQPGVYVSEYVPAKYRGRFLGLVETSWVYGALLAIAFPFFLFPAFGWRLTFLVALIPLFLIPLVIFFAPESLRYLQLKGRTDEVASLLKKHGLARTEFNGGRGLSELTPTRYDVSAALKELWSRAYWKRTALLWVSWPVLVFTYHGIFVWLPTIYQKEFGFTVVKSLSWVFVVTLAQVPGYYSAALLLDRIGRKPVFIIYLAEAAWGSIMLGLVSEPTWILFWSIVISFFNLGAWSALYAYTPELYATRVRGAGSGAAASMGRLAGVFSQPAMALLYAYGGLAASFTMFAIVHFIGSLTTAILGTETKGKVLEEISEE